MLKKAVNNLHTLQTLTIQSCWSLWPKATKVVDISW